MYLCAYLCDNPVSRIVVVVVVVVVVMHVHVMVSEYVF